MTPSNNKKQESIEKDDTAQSLYLAKTIMEHIKKQNVIITGGINKSLRNILYINRKTKNNIAI